MKSGHLQSNQVPGAKRSLQIFIRGQVIDVQSRESGVVYLVARANQQHGGLVGRLRQYLANALFRAGDLCDTSNHNQPIRVVQRHVPPHAVNDGLTNLGDDNVIEVEPIYTADGDAHYQALVLYEGVKEHGDRIFPTSEIAGFVRQEGADDSHIGLQRVDWLKHGILPHRLVVMPDAGNGGAA